MDAVVKEEKFEAREVVPKETRPSETSKPVAVIDLSSSDYDSDDSDDSDDDSAMNPYAKRSNASNGVKGSSSKKQKLENLGIVLPLGFLDPLPPEEPLPLPAPVQNSRSPAVDPSYKQFWKAGDYEGGLSVDSSSLSSVGMDHVRVHPKFLHSNATSHKWALGAFAELLDNSLDEACHGATFVNIDMLENKKDGSRMLLVEDNGGGMDPDKIRQCMSLGYSEKSKLANTIGQYGNGFKTSTMRLGADVIVFSRCYGKDGQRPTQSIGLLSYTFLRSTAKQDIVVPMLDYEKGGKVWNRLMRLSPGDWDRNVETILQWSPYSSEADLLQQFNLMDDQGTRVIIYNLWEDDQGELELDFGTDRHDIQIRGVNRDEKKIEMAKHFPNSRHFLTYRHSLRSYASILYLRLPRGFRIVLRGKDVEHHNIVNDMMLIQEVTYRPQPGADGVPKDPNMVAVVTLGFVKDAKDHIDVQGFNVYHKNRLIKPFWRVWNPAGSDGRGVIGVLEANFVEPAHDKQGFERTTVLSRLEARLVQMQKTFWSTYCHKIGYAPRYQRKHVNESAGQESSPEYRPRHWSRHSKNFTTLSDSKGSRKYPIESTKTRVPKHGSKTCSSEPLSPSVDDDSDSEMRTIPPKGQPTGTNCKASQAQNSLQRERAHITRSFSQNSENSEIELDRASTGRNDQIVTCLQPMASVVTQNGDGFAANVDAPGLNQLQVENCELKDRLKKMEESFLHDLGLERERRKSAEAQLNGHSLSNSDARSVLQLKMENRELKDRLKKREEVFLRDLQIEKDRCKSLEAQLKESQQKIEEINKEQEILIDIFSEEKERRCTEEENLRKKLKVASDTIQELLDKLKLLGNIKSPKGNPESLQEK